MNGVSEQHWRAGLYADTSAVHDIHYAFLGLLASFLVCVLLQPAGLWHNDGFSYFGAFRATVLPYALGIACFVYFTLRAAASLPAGHRLKSFSWMARLYVVSAAGILATPYNVEPFARFHVIFGATLFFTQFLAGLLLALMIRTRATVLMFLAMLTGGLMSLFYLPLPPNHGFLLEGQLIFQLGFWGLLARSVQYFMPMALTGRTAKA